MTLTRRFAVLAAAAVAIAIVLASALVYVVVRGELRGQLDDQLRSNAENAAPIVMRVRGALPPGEPPPFVDRLPGPRDALGLQTAYVALVDADGRALAPGGARLPVTAETRAVAAGERKEFFADARVDDAEVRVLTSPGPPGLAIQVARPLGDVNRTLDRLAVVLGLVSAGGIALAAALGRLVARTAVQPVSRLTTAAEHVAQTSDLGRRIEVEPGRDDEIARLSRSFNAMLAALESSVGRQRQLVADASHELRTPLTSVRTNVEVLARSPQLPEDERQLLVADVVAQLDELGALVGDVVELAREAEPAAELEDVRFDELVVAAVARAERRPGAPAFDAALEPCVVRGVPARLDRAVANLLDNAVKWSPDGGRVDVALRDGELTVRDRGPGIPPDDLPHVFERFYRAPSARGMPGSGLGLAIVRQVAELHGGGVAAETAHGGGALLRLRLPAEPLRAPPDIEPAAVPAVDTEGY
jgi:two-component system, OmpR family, sensor histidine kinase MprB